MGSAEVDAQVVSEQEAENKEGFRVDRVGSSEVTRGCERKAAERGGINRRTQCNGDFGSNGGLKKDDTSERWGFH